MQSLANILLIDDNPSFLEDALPLYGYKVSVALNGVQAMKKLNAKNEEKFDLILLDVMMPQMDGWETLKAIRESKNYKSVPIIMATAVNDEQKQISGLKFGADDYITKPFEIEELLARMRSLFRRMASFSQSGGNSCKKVRSLELKTDSMEVFLEGKPVELSKTEFLLLKCFMENVNTVLSRDVIISAVWGREHYIDENSVDVYVRYLRAKIDDSVGEEYISTVRGAGYVMRDEA